MFFDDASKVEEIASRSGASLFVIPDEVAISIPKALIVQPEDTATISVEQIRELISKLELKQVDDLFVIIRPAEKMSLVAANAFLKCLEEPGEKVHFILVTDNPSVILPTILSRTAIYFLRVVDDGKIRANDKVKEVAKSLMVARGEDLVAIADKISKKKEAPRAYALEVVGTAIEMLYRTYFITKKDVFLEKLPKFLAAYEALSRNGHIKLSIVAGIC